MTPTAMKHGDQVLKQFAGILNSCVRQGQPQAMLTPSISDTSWALKLERTRGPA